MKATEPSETSTPAAEQPSYFFEVDELIESLFCPLDISDDSISDVHEEESDKSHLNRFLKSRDISPVRSCLDKPWSEAGDRTKRYYVRKASQAVEASLNVIAPKDSDELWHSLVKSKGTSSNDLEYADNALLECLVQCYNEADQWDTRRQILSIMAEKLSYNTICMWIPDLTRYRYKIAKRHSQIHGIGVPVPIPCQTRMRVPQEKLDHFICFITSQHIVQDLPFGEKKLTLSTNEVITIPNIIRSIVPERIVKQYQQYCSETNFSPLSRSTLLRILEVCKASVRKSLQGLDYIAASGATAFDDLLEAVEKLGDLGMGMSWAKEIKKQLALGKRYLKSDYKVIVCYRRQGGVEGSGKKNRVREEIKLEKSIASSFHVF